MAATRIANSVVTNQISPETSFNVTTTTFLMVCTRGELVLQVQMTEGWVNLSQLNDIGMSAPARCTAGQALAVTNLGTGLNYRLRSPAGKSTGSVYELA